MDLQNQDVSDYKYLSYLFSEFTMVSMAWNVSCKIRSDVVISQIQSLAEDVEPLLAEVHDSGLLKEVEKLTKSLTRASEDLR